MSVRTLTRVVLLALLWSTQASAALSLNRMVIYFNPDSPPREDVIVANPDSETLYLQTEVYEVKNPGSEKEQQIRITDPSQMTLLASPSKAVIPPGSRKTVRLVSLEKPTANERVYRVTFKPVIGDIQASQTAIKLLIAYQTLVFIRPDNPAYRVNASQKGRQLVFTNAGNINVVMRNGQYCTSQKDDSCQPIAQGARIYAGQSWTLDIPPAAVRIKYGLFDGALEQSRVFPVRL